MTKTLPLDLGCAELPDGSTDRGVEPKEQDQPPTLRRGDAARLVLQREDRPEVESPRIEGPVSYVGQPFVARGPHPRAERTSGRIARRSGAEDTDRLVEIVDLRRDVGVQERQADAGQQLVLVIRKIARQCGHDVLDVGQDDADDVGR